jgi:hypothetical protein
MRRRLVMLIAIGLLIAGGAGAAPARTVSAAPVRHAPGHTTRRPAKQPAKHPARTSATATRASTRASADADSTARLTGGPRRLEDIHIEGEIPAPQVLFVTARDQRRFTHFHHQRYVKTSVQVGETTQLPTRIALTSHPPAAAGAP